MFKARFYSLTLLATVKTMKELPRLGQRAAKLLYPVANWAHVRLLKARAPNYKPPAEGVYPNTEEQLVQAMLDSWEQHAQVPDNDTEHAFKHPNPPNGPVDQDPKPAGSA